MRIRAALALALALGGCAAEHPRNGRFGPPPMGPDGPGGGPRPGGPGGGPPFGGRGTFISPMGEPFRSTEDGRSSEQMWFEQADTDHDGRLTLAEMRADAQRFFLTLDVDKDGEIDPQEIERYETEVAPEIRVGGGAGGGGGNGPPSGGRHGGGGRGGHGGGMGGGMGGGGMGGGGMGGGGMGGGGMGGGGMGDGPGGGPGGDDAAARSSPPGGGMGRRGAARFSFFDLPEPVVAADTNFNRGVSAKEFDIAASDRFQLLDTARQGYLTLVTLPPLARDGRRSHDAPPPAPPPGNGG